MEKDLVSVVILTYNGEKEISETLNSVFNQSYNNIEIIVVDNASMDGTKEIVRNTQYPIPNTQIYNKKNIGFTGGHNVGIRESSGEYVLCMNQDVILGKDFILEAAKVFEQDEKIGAIQGKLINKDLGVVDTAGLVAFKNRRFADRGQGEKDKGQYDKIEEVFGFNGAAPVFRKACLEDVKIQINGGPSSVNHECYDGDFFMYKEDVDLSWRMRLYGWKIMYCPEVVAYPARSSVLLDAESQSYWQIIKTRRKQIPRVQYYSFKNQRLMQIKNELPWLFFKHLPWILPKEIASWLYVLFCEPKTWPAISELFRQMPRAWKKRKIIMQNRRVGIREIEKWFK